MAMSLPDTNTTNPNSWSIAVMIIITIYAAIIPLFLIFILTDWIYMPGLRAVAFNEIVIDRPHILASFVKRRYFTSISITNHRKDRHPMSRAAIGGDQDSEPHGAP